MSHTRLHMLDGLQYGVLHLARCLTCGACMETFEHVSNYHFALGPLKHEISNDKLKNTSSKVVA